MLLIELYYYSVYYVKTSSRIEFVVLQEGIAIGRSFAIMENEQVDGNKEMVAFGLMNIVGSFTSCYLTTGLYFHQKLSKLVTIIESLFTSRFVYFRTFFKNCSELQRGV